MPANIFISYSHKDESFKESLVEHMSGLKRAGLVSEWNDRKIISGEDWSKEISENLKESNIIIFLISASFLDSDYCVNIEAKTALEMHASGRAKLIPVLVRPVSWSDSNLSHLQALPKDAMAVSLWDNKDQAWVDVINGIRPHLNQVIESENSSIENIERRSSSPSLAPSMLGWLEDTEITLTHRRKSKVNLSDVYVIPDVEVEAAEGEQELRQFKSACKLPLEFDRFLVSGEEQQGKTSLLKYYYIKSLKESFLPIYIDGVKIKDANSEAIIKKEISSQYDNLSYEDFISSPHKIIMIDNIDEIPLNKKHRDKFISEVCSAFEKCIFTLHLSYSLLVDEVPALDDFERTEILGMGNKRREELIQKWISLGVEQTISDTDLYSKCDEIAHAINVVVKKNVVPPRPIYILMLLQMFEASSKLNLELSSHGHCYQQLIYQSFSNAKIIESEFDKYLNVLTELSWSIFLSGSNPTDPELELFFKEYCKEYLKVNGATVIDKLAKHSILQKKDSRTGFKYPYIYYFFVGKKISESYLESEDVRAKVEELISNLHREDFANILIFVAHHTKDSWVVSKLRDALGGLFKDQPSASLDRAQLSFMDDFMRKIPELIIEQREVQKERDRHNENLDRSERNEAKDEEGAPSDILASINKTFKGMEIAGQIIRNRHASLKRDKLFELAEDGINSGLRFLKYFIAISDVAKKEILKVISSHLSENPSLTNIEIEKYAESAYLHLTYGVINGVVRKIATSVGSKEAMEIYKAIEQKSSTPAMLLLKQSIELHFLKKIDMDGLSCCAEELRGNPVCTRILKELVVQHIYMFPVEYKEKQQISSILGIPMSGQQIIQRKQKRVGP